MRWFEPDPRKIRIIKAVLLFSSVLILGVIFFELWLILANKISPEETFFVKLHIPFLIFIFYFFIDSYISYENRLGYDGENVYIRNKDGIVWQGLPNNLVYSGGKIYGFYVIITDKNRKSLYIAVEKEEIEKIISKAKKVTGFYLIYYDLFKRPKPIYLLMFFYMFIFVLAFIYYYHSVID